MSDAPASLAGQTVWVVDANSLIFQVFHALPEMTSPQGEPVSAVFGFARDMLYLLEEKKPDYLFVAFDGPEQTFRHELYENYKGNRSEMPVDLVPQFAPIGRLLDGLGVPGIAVEGFEADDLLATIAHQTHELGGECYLVTGDKDCRQLITDRVKVYNIRKDQMFDAAALAADWGIRPDQVVDFQALVGDSGRQRAGRAADRAEDRRRVPAKVRHAGRPVGARRRGAQGQAAREPDRRCASRRC